MQDISRETFIQAQKGDIRSFEIIYKESSGFVYSVSLRMLGNKQDAEEITQEVFLSVYRNLRKFRFQSSFKTWIYRIAVNYALNRLRKTSRDNDKKKEYMFDLDVFGRKFSEQDIDDNKDAHKKMVDMFLKSLNEEQRACVVLRNIEGLSYKDISSVLRVNINTVRTRLKRARERMMNFRKEVSEYEP